MAIEEVYNKLAKTYNKDLSAKIIETAHDIAFESIKANLSTDNKIKILGLGVGDGKFLLRLKSTAESSEFTGVDISQRMLERAKKTLELKTCHSSVQELDDKLPHHYYDIITAHFITAYVPLHITIKHAKLLLNDQGILSLLTNTMQSFSQQQKMMHEFSKSKNLIKKLIAYYGNRILETVCVPKNMADIERQCQEQGCKILQKKEHTFEITFIDKDEMYDVLINGSWYASAFTIKWLPSRMMERILKFIGSRYIKFPFTDNITVINTVITNEH